MAIPEHLYQHRDDLHNERNELMEKLETLLKENKQELAWDLQQNKLDPLLNRMDLVDKHIEQSVKRGL